MSENYPIVYIVDDDARIREALSDLMSLSGLQAAVFGSAAEFLAFHRPDVPSCLVLDLELPDVNGLQLQQSLTLENTSPIVFISGHGDIPSSVRAMKAGAIEFLPKPFDEQDLLRAIHAGIELDRANRLKRKEFVELQRRYKLLSPREREVLPLVVAGFANKVTAAHFGTCEKTIGVQRGQVMRKMGARSLAELVTMARTLGIEFPEPT